MNYRSRMFINRVVNILRPKPRMVPLRVEDILETTQAKDVVDRFRDLLYSSGVMGTLHWKGVPVIKNPCDLWTTIELFEELRPTVVLETGTHLGGSAMFYADVAKVLGLETCVITVDHNPKWSIDPRQAGIVSIVGISTSPKVTSAIRAEVEKALKSSEGGHVLVFLDSDHSEDNVLNELREFAPMVTVGSYIVVEDTNVNGHPSAPEHGPGPWEAVQAFLLEDERFEADRGRERFLLTFNPGGWLKRTR